MTESAAVPAFTPLVKVVAVKAAPEKAFRRFTAEMAVWWPLASHSVGGANSESVEMEPRVGGRIVERIRGGRECVWGTITAWDPPRRVAFTWHPGDAPARAQDVEVQFTADGAGTRVQLTHSGFERLGKDARLARRGYPLGWAYVLGLYAERRGPFMQAVTWVTAAFMRVHGWRERRRARNQSAKAT
jgi:uncharacterized protein YndB with AHSA1/START domain